MFVEERCVHGKEFFVAAGLDDALAGVVNHDGALLGLLVGVTADIDERFDDIVEGVVVVVGNDELAAVVVE